MKRYAMGILLLIAASAFGAVSVSVNGTSYSIPQANERGWGTSVTSWIQAISSNTLQPNSGTFTLSADLDFGANYGLKSLYYKTRNANPASAGQFRLGNTETIQWRNAANGGDLPLTVNASDRLQFNSVNIPTISSTDTLTNKAIAAGSNTITGLADANIDAAAAIADTKLATISTAGKVSNSATTATNLNTASAIVARDGSGNFTAGTITANLTGNVTGNVTGNASGTAANVTGTVAIANGGTGQTSQTAAFDALAPTTTKGDVIVHNGSDNVRVAVGSNGQVLMADSTQSSGVKWGAGGGGGIFQASQNLLTNNSWEIDDSNWTASGGTYQRETGAANIVPPGVGASSWDASASAQTLTANTVTITSNDGLSGRNGVVSCAVKTAATDLKLQAYDGTNVLTPNDTIDVVPSSSAGFVRYSLNFVFPSSGTITARFYSQSNSAIAYIDDCYLGLAEGFNVSSANSITSWTSFTMNIEGSTSNPTKASSPTDDKAYWRQIGDSMEITYSYRHTSNAGAAAGSGTYLFKIPSGYTIDSNKVDTTSITEPGVVGSASAYASGGTGTGYVKVYDSTHLALVIGDEGIAPGLVGSAFYELTQATAVYSFKATIPIQGWTAETSFRPDQVGWRVDANISGANISLGTSSQSSYVEMTNGSLTLTNNSGRGVLTAQIACASGTASSGTTCSAANESNGIAFTLPKAGDVKACVAFSHDLNTTAGDSATVFQIVETTNTSSAVVQEGKERVQQYANGTRTGGVPFRVCGTFTFSSSGQKTLRLAYEQSGGTISASTVLADASTSNGQRDIKWEVYPIENQTPAPLLVGSVTSNSSGRERIERAYITGASTVSSQSGSWISSVTNNATGDRTLNIASGIFSAAPVCTVNIIENTVGIPNAWYSATIISTSTSAVRFLTWYGAGTAGTANNYDAQIICMGPR